MKLILKIIGVVFAILLLIVFNFPQKLPQRKKLTIMNLLDENKILQVLINEEDIKIIPKDNSEYKGKVLFTVNINDEKLISKLQDFKMSYSSVEIKENTNSIIIVIFIFLIVFIYVVWRNRFLKHKVKASN